MKVFHEWGKIEEVAEALPTFTTSDIGHFFIVANGDDEKADVAADLGGEEGDLSQGCEGGPGGWRGTVARPGDDTSPRASKQ